MKDIITEGYWDHRYEEMDTPWDIGYANEGLVDLVMQYFDNEDKLLIPGAGIGHEAAMLFQMGFRNVHICDWAPHAVSAMHNKYPDFPESNIIINDFFKLDEKFDGIIEQTFLCALPVEQRPAYAEKCRQLLNENGRYTGVLFSKTFPFDGPPFGGSIEEYRDLFNEQFNIERLEEWEGSIKPRKGSECILVMAPGKSVKVL